MTISNDSHTNFSMDNSSGAVYLRNLATGYVTSSSGTLGTSSSIPNSDVAGLGNLATQNVPSSGYVTSNGSTLSSSTTISHSNVTGLGTLATLNVPSGIVSSNGSALTSSSTVPHTSVLDWGPWQLRVHHRYQSLEALPLV